MNLTNLIVACFLLAASTVWGFEIVRTVWFAGDRMAGFSPFLLLSIPAALGVLLVGGLLAGMRKSILIGSCSLLGFGAIAAPMVFLHQIELAAWNHSLRKFNLENQAAIESTDFSGAEFSFGDFPDEQKMVLVSGFSWHCEHHIAAPNGQFRGFLYSSIPHIYVNKIRHGLRGVAWVDNPENIPENSDFEYQPSGVDHWYFWTYGGF